MTLASGGLDRAALFCCRRRLIRRLRLILGGDRRCRSRFCRTAEAIHQSYAAHFHALLPWWIFYVLWSGCQWKASVHDYLELWDWGGTLERIHHAERICDHTQTRVDKLNP